MIYPRTQATPVSGPIPQQHLYFDTTADFPNLPKLDRAAPGSDAYCVTTQEVYILSGEGVWEVQ